MFQSGADLQKLRNENTQLRRQLVHLSEELIDSSEQINRLKRKVRALARAEDSSPKDDCVLQRSPQKESGAGGGQPASAAVSRDQAHQQKVMKAMERRVAELEAECARTHQIATKQSEDLIAAGRRSEAASQQISQLKSMLADLGIDPSSGGTTDTKRNQMDAKAPRRSRSEASTASCSLSVRPTAVRLQQDSPLAAAQLAHAADRLGSFLTFAEASAKALEVYVAAGEQFSRAGAQASTLLRTSRYQPWAAEVPGLFEGLAAVARACQDQSSYLEVMVASVRQAYCEPIVAFAKARTGRAGRAVQAAELASQEAHAAVWNFLATGSSAPAEAVRKAEEEAAAATRRAEAARFDAVRLLNEAELSKRAELGERLCGVYYALRAYGQQMQLSLSRLEPTTRALQAEAATASALEKQRAVLWRQLAAAMHSELGRAFTTSGQARAGVTERARMPGAADTAAEGGGGADLSSEGEGAGRGGGSLGLGKPSAAGKEGLAGGSEGSGTGSGLGGAKPSKAPGRKMAGGIGVGDGAGLDEAGGAIAPGPLDLVNAVVESVAARVREQLEEGSGADGEEGGGHTETGGNAAGGKAVDGAKGEALKLQVPPSSADPQGGARGVTPLSPGLTRAAARSLEDEAPRGQAGSGGRGSAKGTGETGSSEAAQEHSSDSMRGGDPSRAELSGWLYKRSSRSIGVRRADWQRRWFFVDKGALWYVRGEKDLNPVQVLSMVVANVRTSDFAEASSPAHDVRFCFEVRSPGERVFYLQAQSALERQRWVSGLRRESEKQLLAAKRASIVGGMPGAAGIGEAGAAGGGGGGSGGDTASGRGNLANDPRVRAIQAANPSCCDCGAERPDWCSLNLGVLLCIACSGVHRSLGTHLSKVRSLTLDALDPQVLSLLEAVGNDRFNAVWEGSIQEGWTRPGPKAPRAERERFIRAKYEWKGFVDVPNVQKRILDPSGGAGEEQGKDDDDSSVADLGDGAGSEHSGLTGPGSVAPTAPTATGGEDSSPKTSGAVAADQAELARSALEAAVQAAAEGDLDRLLLCAAAGAEFEGSAPGLRPGAPVTTALHEAARSGHGVVVEWLLQNGARADVTDGAGVLPASSAAEAGHEKLAALIKSRE